jgi:two-component system, LytTR family, sensor kinase
MLVSAAWIGPAVLGAINEIAQNRLWGRPQDLSQILFTSGDWLLYAFLTPAVFAIAERWPIARPQLARRALLHGAISLMFCAVWAGTGTLLRVALQGVPEDGWGRSFVSWTFITLPFGVSVYLAVVGIEHAIRYFTEARDREIQMARLSEQLSGARFAALQAQLNPHFLFNTLNTIAVLVRDGDRTGASRMIEQLGAVLRRTLNRGRANEVSLHEELELVGQYLAIEHVRFPDRLRPDLEVDPAVAAAAVPSFIVQHLVENAIRHGIARSAGGGRVRVAVRRDGDTLVITVSDDGPGFDVAAPLPERRGLANTRERLRALYGQQGTLGLERGPAGGTVATLRIPYHEAALDVDDGPGVDRSDRG